MSASPHTLAPGSVVDARYTITKLLGEGGFGAVYAATQLSTGQPVAIKILRPERLEQRSEGDAALESARFQREMQVIAKLGHPNIVRLIDTGSLDGGALYIVLEYIEGEPLSSLLTAGGLQPELARRIMSQVLDALCCAHEEGIVHRDLKPHNIMVSRTGGHPNAKVLDFGIAGVIEEARDADYRTLSTDGSMRGTPAYMAPEQLDDQKVTLQSDIYAWGLVYIECLTGVPAIPGESLGAIIFHHMSPEPVPMPGVLRTTPLGALLERAVAKPLEARFASTRDLLHALDTCPPLELTSAQLQVDAATVPESFEGLEPTLSGTLDGPHTQTPTTPIPDTLVGRPPPQPEPSPPSPARAGRVVLAAGVLGSVALLIAILMFFTREPRPLSTPPGPIAANPETSHTPRPDTAPSPQLPPKPPVERSPRDLLDHASSISSSPTTICLAARLTHGIVLATRSANASSASPGSAWSRLAPWRDDLPSTWERLRDVCHKVTPLGKAATRPAVLCLSEPEEGFPRPDDAIWLPFDPPEVLAARLELPEDPELATVLEYARSKPEAKAWSQLDKALGRWRGSTNVKDAVARVETALGSRWPVTLRSTGRTWAKRVAKPRAKAQPHWTLYRHLDTAEGTASLQIGDLCTALASPHVSGITHWTHSDDFNEEMVLALRQNGWPKRLLSLDLSACSMTDDAIVGLLASELPALRHLSLGTLHKGANYSRAPRPEAVLETYQRAFSGWSLSGLRTLRVEPYVFQDESLAALAEVKVLRGLTTFGVPTLSRYAYRDRAQPLPDAGWRALFSAVWGESLEVLDLSGLLAHISYAARVKSWFQSLGPLTETQPFPNLETLVLNHCDFGPYRARELRGWKQLQQVRRLILRGGLRSLRHVGDLLGTASYDRLEELDLSRVGSRGPQPTPGDFEALLALKAPHLKVLRLAGCELSSKTVKVLAKSHSFPELEVLDLRANALGAGGRALAKCKGSPTSRGSFCTTVA